MGFRTVVILNNDMMGEWSKDPLLGEMIARDSATPFLGGKREREHLNNYGSVVQCCHADHQSLAVIDSLGMQVITNTTWHSGQTVDERNLTLLKQMADQMGYRLVKKNTVAKKVIDK